MGADVAVTARPPATPRRGSSPLPDDEQLARLTGDGDEQAFSALYERYHQPLYRYARSLVRNDADAQDALQSALTNALLALRERRRDAPLRPWLYRIVHNESISLLRRHRGHAELSEAATLADASTEERVEERARLTALVADLQELPERQRGALLMHELSDLSHEEIAASFEVSNGVARQLVYEARRSLQEFAEGRTMSCDEVCRTISDGDGRALRGRKIRAHMRECPGCTAFAAAIPERRSDLKAIAPPIPALAAAGVLAHVLGAGSAQAAVTGSTAVAVGAGSGSGGGGAAVGAAGSSAGGAGAGAAGTGGAAAVGAGSGAGGAAGVGAATAGKTALLALSSKAVAGIAAVAVATAGAGVAVQQITSSPSTAHHSAGGSSAGSSASGSGATGGGASNKGANGRSHSQAAGGSSSSGTHGASGSHRRSSTSAKHGSGSHGKSSSTPTAQAPGHTGSSRSASGTSAASAHSKASSHPAKKAGSTTSSTAKSKSKRHHPSTPKGASPTVGHAVTPAKQASAPHSRPGS